MSQLLINDYCVVMSNTYQDVLNILDRQVDTLTQEAGEQMACRKGCASCCSNTFKITTIEANYLWQGFQQASEAIQEQITEQAFITHRTACPVLIDGACSLYQHRPLLCRAYGVMLKVDETVSTCHLNFNNIDGGNAPSVLELDPFYEVATDLSNASEKQTIAAHLLQRLAPLKQVK